MKKEGMPCKERADMSVAPLQSDGAGSNGCQRRTGVSRAPDITGCRRLCDVRCETRLWNQRICFPQTGGRPGARAALPIWNTTVTRVNKAAAAAAANAVQDSNRHPQEVPGDAAHLHPSQLSKEQEENGADQRLPSGNMTTGR